MILLSPRLSLDQFVATQHRQYLMEQSSPPAEVLMNAHRFAADIWEPIINLIGMVHLNSGYRCHALNSDVKGSKNSYHMIGLAVDIMPTEMSILTAINLIINSNIPYDEIIFEYRKWLHIQGARHGYAPRRLARTTDDGIIYKELN